MSSSGKARMTLTAYLIIWSDEMRRNFPVRVMNPAPNSNFESKSGTSRSAETEPNLEEFWELELSAAAPTEPKKNQPILCQRPCAS
ncbi:hypothetical protein lerEdw1_019159 [Lerista edwardsae]|nr:hypothetical protein lerEdw1_019159 [Lerista edwardsae]